MTSPASNPAEGIDIKGGRKLLVGLALALAAALLAVAFFSHRGLYQLYRFRSDKLHLEQENNRLAAENDRLARTIDRLQHDPEMIQDRIRRELNFIKKNEVIFQLPPAAPAKPQVPPPPVTAAPKESASPTRP